jgi:hypothetical protein
MSRENQMSNNLTNIGRQLIGRWITDPNDVAALKAYGQVTLVFGADGSLRYIVRGENKNEVIILKYRIENDWLITDQLSAPREERTPFKFTEDGKLVLQYGQLHSHYVRDDPEQVSKNLN